MVLVNVVVAVLLDKFVTEQEEEPEEIDADALLDGASDVGTEASRQATAKPPKKTDDKLDLLIKEVAKLQLAVADLRAMHPQAGELTVGGHQRVRTLQMASMPILFCLDSSPHCGRDLL